MADPDGALTGSGRTAGLRELMQVLGVPDVPEAASLLPDVHLKSVPQGRTLVHEGQPVAMLYIVLTGSFKQSRLHVDGYEQVLGFPQRADLIGFTGLAEGAHPTSAIALEDASVVAMTPASLYELERRLPGFAAAMHRALAWALDERSALADLMAAVASEVRVARFLAQTSARALARGLDGTRLQLRMSRRDIASYLGLAHETISRAFKALSDAKLLRVSRREVCLLDIAGLRSFGGSTRRRQRADAWVAARPRQAAPPWGARHAGTPAACTPASPAGGGRGGAASWSHAIR